MKKIKNLKGQLLIEIIITIALTSILLPAFITGFVASREGKGQTSNRLEATALLKEAEEAVRVIRENDWNNLTNGTFHPEIDISGTNWELAIDSENLNGFNREIVISDVNRDSSGNITTSGGTLDPSTKKAEFTVSWNSPISSSVESTIYLQRYIGNTEWLQTTRNEFNNGTFNNTVSTNSGGGPSRGAVELDNTGGIASLTDDFDIPSDYSYDPNKIEVVSSFAQLKPQGAIVSGSTVNSGFDTDNSNWTFENWGQNRGQTGNYQSSGGIPNGYIDINLPTLRNRKIGGYWYQPFTTTVNNPTATLNFDWQVSSFDPTPDSFRVYAFVDTDSSDPDEAQSVWDSGEIIGTTSWSSTATIDVSSKVTSPGTYYLKVAIFVDYPNSNTGPFEAGFDNVLLSWSGTSGSSYATDSPTIYNTTALSAPSITSWNGFNETAIKNGGEIYYQLSDDNGSTWQWFDGSNWANTVSATDYNLQSIIDLNIDTFPTINSQISVRSFFISDSTQQVRLDQIEITYSGSSIGTYISDTFDAGQIVGFNNMVFTDNNTPDTATKLQVAVNSDNATWTYLGPNGATDTYFTQDGPIHLSQASGQYLRFFIEFTSTSNDKPEVLDVSINYSP